MTKTRPENLPRGFADDHTLRLDYLRWRAEYGHPGFAELLEREERRGFSTLLFDPEPGHLYDAGIEHYREFICSLETATELVRDGSAEVVTRFTNGAQMRYRV
jgi:hypothetical protein